MDVHKLFIKGDVITHEDITDTYTNYIVRYSLSNYKIFTLKSLIGGDFKIERGIDIPDYAFDFIAEQGRSIGISNPVAGHVFSMKLKSLNEKKFITIGEKRTIPYGLGMLEDFHYGDWLCLVEGGVS